MIPHAHTDNVIPDPPRKILHIGTAMSETPLGHNFNAGNKKEMMEAIANKVADEGLDEYEVHWEKPDPKQNRNGQ